MKKSGLAVAERLKKASRSWGQSLREGQKTKRHPPRFGDAGARAGAGAGGSV